MKVYIIDKNKDTEFERRPDMRSYAFYVPFSHDLPTGERDGEQYYFDGKEYAEVQITDRILRKLKTREIEALEEENILIKIENKKLRSEVEDVRSKVALLYGSLKEEWRAFYE